MAIAVCGGAAASQLDAQPTRADSVASCLGDGADANPSACSALIESGRETPLSLASAFTDRGNAYLSKRDFAHAIQDFDHAIRMKNDYVEPFLGLCAARAYADKGFERALADCDEALRLDPGNADALGLRGLVYFKMGHYEKAIADCNQVLSRYPQSPFSLYLRGRAKRMNHDSAGGDVDIAAATALRPSEPQQFAAYGVKP